MKTITRRALILFASLVAIALGTASQAITSTMLLTGVGGGGGGGGAPVFTPTLNPAIQFINFGSATVTFSSQPIGAATADRILIIGVTNLDSGRVVNSIQVAGTYNLTRGVSANGGTAQTIAELWYGSVPAAAGTTANIVVTYSSAPQLSGILGGTLSGQSAGASATPSATNAKALDTVADPQQFAAGMTVNSGGVGIVYSVTAVAGSAASWTSTTAGAGDYWVSTSSGNAANHALAHTTTPGSWSPTVSNMGAFSGNALVAMAFAP
jgi:hypothetical protein